MLMSVRDLSNSRNLSGYKYVVPCGGRRGFQASRNGGGRPDGWRGPMRPTAREAAQDYCDHINGALGVRPARPALRSAGHDTTPRAPLPRDPEVLAALGVLRDARAQRRGVQGFVYLIVEAKPSGELDLNYGKIGYSTNPSKRVAELQTGNPRPLRLHLSKPGTEADEAALHQKYIKDNVLAEWFRISKALLLEWDASHRVPAAQSGGTSHKEATAA